MAQSILSRALNGPSPEARLRTFLETATLEEVHRVEEQIVMLLNDYDGSPAAADRALVRVAERWLELVVEHRLALTLR